MSYFSVNNAPSIPNDHTVQFYYLESSFPYNAPEAIITAAGTSFNNYATTHAGIGVWDSTSNVKFSIEFVANNYTHSLFPAVTQNSLTWENTGSVVITNPINEDYWVNSRLIATSVGVVYTNLIDYLQDNLGDYSYYQPVTVTYMTLSDAKNLTADNSLHGYDTVGLTQILPWNSYVAVDVWIKQLANFGCDVDSFLTVYGTGFYYFTNQMYNDITIDDDDDDNTNRRQLTSPMTPLTNNNNNKSPLLGRGTNNKINNNNIRGGPRQGPRGTSPGPSGVPQYIRDLTAKIDNTVETNNNNNNNNHNHNNKEVKLKGSRTTQSWDGLVPLTPLSGLDVEWVSELDDDGVMRLVDGSQVPVVTWGSPSQCPAEVRDWYTRLYRCYVEVFNVISEDKNGGTLFAELISSCYKNETVAYVFASPTSVFKVSLISTIGNVSTPLLARYLDKMPNVDLNTGIPLSTLDYFTSAFLLLCIALGLLYFVSKIFKKKARRRISRIGEDVALKAVNLFKEDDIAVQDSVAYNYFDRKTSAIQEAMERKKVSSNPDAPLTSNIA